MEFIQNHWFWIVVFGFFVWMHSSGMGCGGHGEHGGHSNRKNKSSEDRPQRGA